MTASKMTLLVLVMLFSAQSMADLVGSKERTTCVGNWQMWIYTWLATGEHADWDNFHASAKKSTGSIYVVQYGNDLFVYCKNVFTGTPLGTENHEWKSVATKFPLGAKDSNETTFFYHDPCTSGGSNN